MTNPGVVERLARHIKGDGETIEVVIYSRPLKYEGRDARIVAAFDITERKKVEDRIVYLAHHDILTGLPNRAAFGERLSDAIVEADAKQSAVAVLCLDLDRFKEVNDVFGQSSAISCCERCRTNLLSRRTTRRSHGLAGMSSRSSSPGVPYLSARRLQPKGYVARSRSPSNSTAGRFGSASASAARSIRTMVT